MHTLIVGDVLEELRRIPTASFDAVLSDIPYGRSWLGLAWDAARPSADVWRELCRVVRPGGNLFVFGAPPTFHRLGVEMEVGGLAVVDLLLWLYAQGRPKARGRLKTAFEPIFHARAPAKGAPMPLDIEGCRLADDSAGEGRRRPGRWPATVAFDLEAAEQLDRMSGHRRSGGVAKGSRVGECRSYRSPYPGYEVAEAIPATSGGASRFFFCPKVRGRRRAHPAQKPIELTEWLARLLHVQDGRLLVPYAGIGSEMVGAVHAGWREVVGIEQNPAYVTIAEGRLAAIQQLTKRVERAPRQLVGRRGVALSRTTRRGRGEIEGAFDVEDVAPDE